MNEKLQAHYENNVRDVVDNRPEAVRNQVAAAMKAAPKSAGEVDAWFKEHIQKEPASHDTALYNVLHGMKEEFKKLLAAPVPAAAPARPV